MPTAAQLKIVTSLQQKKYRQQHGLFVVEGAKALQELAASDWFVEAFWVTEDFMRQHPEAAQWDPQPEVVAESTLAKVSSLQTNHTGLAVVRVPKESEPIRAKDEWILLLDSVRDPGNLGTIIRIADWYGVTRIICSPDTVDSFNPKTVQATMGSFLRVAVSYQALEPLLAAADVQVLAAVLDGENLHKAKLSPGGGYLLLGSESHGINAQLERFVTRRLTIPKFGGAESLNVGVATALFLDALRRS